MLYKIGKIVFAHKTHIVRNYCSISGVSKMSAEINAGVPLNKIISTLEDFAPLSLSEGWDNTGLLVEPYTQRYVKYYKTSN